VHYTATRSSRVGFLVVSALVFIASVAATVALCVSMSTMNDMPMPGGWSMSMSWSRMCGQTWPRGAAAFIGMWIVMMTAMMLPSLAPVLWRYHESVGRLDHARAGRMTACVGLGYLMVWVALGAAAFPSGAAWAALTMQWSTLARGVPAALGATVLIAGLLQFSPWKARHLACCRTTPRCGVGQERALAAMATDLGDAWRAGWRHGLHCVCCCAGPTAVLLAAGMMDWRVMTAVAAAITAERLAPDGKRVARVSGALAVAIGLAMLARAGSAAAVAVLPR
jgi:predicted metal-binding membrane protein